MGLHPKRFRFARNLVIAASLLGAAFLSAHATAAPAQLPVCMQPLVLDPTDEEVLNSGRGKRLALVVNQLRYGGAEVQVSVIARALAARGWEVAIFSLRAPLALTEELAAAGVAVHSASRPEEVPAWKASSWFIRELRRFHPDVIHSHMYRTNIWMRLLRPFVRWPVLVSTAHNITEGGQYSEFRGYPEITYRVTDRLSSMTTNVSRAAVERYVRLGAVPRGRIRYMPNGIETERFRPDLQLRNRTRAALGLEDCPVILAVGRFVPQKNYPMMLQAFARVRTDDPEAVLLIAGDGPKSHDPIGLENYASELGVGDSVRFLGLRDDVLELMNAADVFVLSSDWEGLPIVLLEASAAGLPMVVTRVGGNPEIVEDGVSGFVVEPGRPLEFAEAVHRVLAMSREARAQMGAAARARVEREYGVDGVVDRWEGLYSELLARR